jgi:hypothetical protein
MTEKSKWELFKEKKQRELEEAAKNLPAQEDSNSQEDRDARPWDILNPNDRAEESVANSRYDICLQCPELIKLTKQCKKCGCFMALKTKVKHASCPIGKW